jgi:hypothetical protein
LLVPFFRTYSLGSAVLYGDEGYADLDGKFYTFYSGGVAVVDPTTCKIDVNITEDDSGQALPAGWSDGIYMQLYPESRRLHATGKDHDHDHDHDHELKGYVLINSRITRENVVGDPVSDVYVFNTEEQKVDQLWKLDPELFTLTEFTIGTY